MRFNSWSKIFSFIFILAVLISCKPALYIPTEAHVTTEVTLQQLTEGRSLYVNSCGSCHSLHLPSEFTKERWLQEINEMQERAKINDSEKQLILNYLWNAPSKLN